MSNRLTFSLASLIFILALGLVFVPTSVMAHEVADGNSGTGQVHAGDTAGDTNHGTHPRVTSITLKAGANVRGTMAAVEEDDGAGDPEIQTFTIVIDFDQDVASAATDTDFATLPTITATNDVVNVNGVVQTATATVAAVTRMGTDNSKFEALVTIATNFPTGMEDADDETLTFRVFVPARSVFSLQTVPNPGQTQPGGPNYRSSTYEFTLVKELPPPTPCEAPSDCYSSR